MALLYVRLSTVSTDGTNSTGNIFDEPATKRKVAAGPKKPAAGVAQKEFDPFENQDEDEDMEPTELRPRNRRALGTGKGYILLRVTSQRFVYYYEIS